MEHEQDYSIQELCDLTGLPRRTIHFYTQQGLLPPPTGAGMGARYSHIHLQRLRLIPVLRHKGLRLDQIRARFTSSTLEDLDALATAVPAPTPSPAPMAMKILPHSIREQQSYQHYTLPAGMTLIVPAVMNSYNSQKLAQLLEAATRIFGEPGLPSNPRLTSE